VVALAKACVGKQVLDVAVAEMLLPEEALGDLKVRRGEEGRSQPGRGDSDLKMSALWEEAGKKKEGTIRSRDGASRFCECISCFSYSPSPPSLLPSLFFRRTTTRPHVTR